MLIDQAGGFQYAESWKTEAPRLHHEKIRRQIVVLEPLEPIGAGGAGGGGRHDEGDGEQQHHDVQGIDPGNAAPQERGVGAEVQFLREPCAVVHRQDKPAQDEEDVDLAAAAQEYAHDGFGKLEMKAVDHKGCAHVRQEHRHGGDPSQTRQRADLMHRILQVTRSCRRSYTECAWSLTSIDGRSNWRN